MPLVRYVRALPSRSNSNRTQLTVDRHIVSVHRFFDVPKQLRRRTPCAGTSNPSALAFRSCRCLSRPFREVDFTTLRPTFAVPMSPSLLPPFLVAPVVVVSSRMCYSSTKPCCLFSSCVRRSSFFVFVVRCSRVSAVTAAGSRRHSLTRPPTTDHHTGPDRTG